MRPCLELKLGVVGEGDGVVERGGVGGVGGGGVGGVGGARRVEQAARAGRAACADVDAGRREVLKAGRCDATLTGAHAEVVHLVGAAREGRHATDLCKTR